MFRKKRSEVLVTNCHDTYLQVCSALKEEHIPYEIKIEDTGYGNRRMGMSVGRIGERRDLEIFYYVYVSCRDEERAKYVIGRKNSTS